MPPQELILSIDPPEKEVLEQILTELHGRRVYIIHPRRSDKVKLVNMALKNLKDEAAKRDKQLSRLTIVVGILFVAALVTAYVLYARYC